ncbi:MAG: YhbY family RNA-binding protein [Spirochaetota bacterium]
MLTSKQRSHLASLAQDLPDLIQLGKAGKTPALVAQLDRLLDSHELVKLRFSGLKEERKELSRLLAAETRSELVRLIGNTAVFWRRQADPEKRKIELE